MSLVLGARGCLWLRLVCLTLNGLATRGPRLLRHLLSTGNPQVWLLGTRAHTELGLKEELDQADRW
jgi:hypothetical protein